MNERILARRGELLGQLLRVARRQADALAANHVDEFLACMELRATIFAALHETEEAPPDNVITFPLPEPSEAIREAHALLPALVEAVLKLDEENERLLQQKMTEIRAALREVRLGFEAAQGYAAATTARGRGRLDLAL